MYFCGYHLFENIFKSIVTTKIKLFRENIYSLFISFSYETLKTKSLSVAKSMKGLKNHREIQFHPKKPETYFHLYK